MMFLSDINTNSKRFNFWFLVALIFTALLILTAFTAGFSKHFVRGETTALVNKTEVKCNGYGKDHQCRYLVFTEKGVFENTDSLLELKWNSSDIHGMVLPGRKYHFTHYGWRFGFTSAYPNIVEINEVPR